MIHTFNWIRRSLRYKIILLVCGAVFITSASIVTFQHLRTVNSAQEAAIDVLAGETRLITLQLKSVFTQMEQDLRLTSHTPPIQGLIRSKANNDIDPKDQSTTLLWRTRLATIFSSLMRSRPNYFQIRYIGVADGGREIVRVDRTDSGLKITDEENLQQKGERPYFKQGLKLPYGQIHFSNLTNNIENGKEETPIRPTLRAVLPIFSDDNTLFGMLVINTDVNILFQNKLRQISPKHSLFVVSHAGDYLEYSPLTGPQSIELSGYYTKKPPEFIQEYQRLPTQEGYFINNQFIDYFVRLPIPSIVENAFWGIVVREQVSLLLQPVITTRNLSLIGGSGLLILSLLLSWIIANRLTAPLRQMMYSIRDALGEQDSHTQLNLPTYLKDEVGALAKAFHDLLTDVWNKEIKIRSIIDNLFDGQITIDPYGTVLMYNPSCVKMFGYQADEVIGKNINMLMPEPYHSEHDNYLDHYRKTGEKHIIGVDRQVRARRKDGSSFPIELSISEIKLDDVCLFSGTIRDITERLAQEEELKRSNEELDSFAYVASHDLKAPLRVIDNASRFLEEDLAEHLNDENKKDMHLLRSRVMRMEKLLDDLLEYSRLGRARDASYDETVSAKELIEDTVALLNPPSSFQISVSEDLTDILVTRMPLQKVFHNLINNAIKHHDKEAGHISIRALKTPSNMYSFEVKDDGPGIAPEYQNKVFEMFQTLKPRDEVEGSGIGLAMVKKAVEGMGGTLRLESREGQGCTFIFTWPPSPSAEDIHKNQTDNRGN